MEQAKPGHGSRLHSASIRTAGVHVTNDVFTQAELCADPRCIERGGEKEVEMRLVVYFDYTCAYSYAAAVWLREVVALERELTVEWQPFVLRETNRPPDEGRPFWQQPGVLRTRTAVAFAAGQAAARQDPDAYDRFRFALQTAVHSAHRDIREPGVIQALASEAGLDVARFGADLEQPGLLEEVGRSHQHAVEHYAVFGTPTLVFPTGCAVYLKLAPAPTDGAAARVFELLREINERHGAIQEIKLTRQAQP